MDNFIAFFVTFVVVVASGVTLGMYLYHRKTAKPRDFVESLSSFMDYEYDGGKVDLKPLPEIDESLLVQHKLDSDAINAARAKAEEWMARTQLPAFDGVEEAQMFEANRIINRLRGKL